MEDRNIPSLPLRPRVDGETRARLVAALLRSAHGQPAPVVVGASAPVADAIRRAWYTTFGCRIEHDDRCPLEVVVTTVAGELIRVGDTPVRFDGLEGV